MATLGVDSARYRRPVQAAGYQSSKVGGLGPRRERRPFPRAELHERWAGLTSPMSSPPRLKGTRWSRVNARPWVGGRFMSIEPPHIQHTARLGSFSSLRRHVRTFFFHAAENAHGRAARSSFLCGACRSVTAVVLFARGSHCILCTVYSCPRRVFICSGSERLAYAVQVSQYR